MGRLAVIIDGIEYDLSEYYYDREADEWSTTGAHLRSLANIPDDRAICKQMMWTNVRVHDIDRVGVDPSKVFTFISLPAHLVEQSHHPSQIIY